MYTALGEERLKNGEVLRTGVVECPDAAWAERVAPFLGHKRPETREHVNRALTGPLDQLETRFYVGTIKERLATEVMIVSARGVGILGHVYTLPEHRRKGAYSRLMRWQMADLARIGVRLLCLSTGFESPPYWIYHSFGFRSIGPGRGEMIWRATPEIERELLDRGGNGAHVRPARWDDWPWFDLLGMQPLEPTEDLPRAAALGLKTFGSLEGAFAPLMLDQERWPAVQVNVLESAGGATAGFAVLRPDRRWFAEVWVADLYVHPAYQWHAEDLLRSLEWPAAPCARYRLRSPGEEESSGDALWRAAGFEPVAALPGWLAVDGDRLPLQVWVRQP